MKTRKNYKNCGFGGNCPKPKMTPLLLKKVFFDMCQNWILLIVFLKSCALLKTLILIVFSAKHSSGNKKLYVEKDREHL